MRRLALVAITAVAIFSGAASPALAQPPAKDSSNDVRVVKEQQGGRGLAGVDAL